MIQLVIVLIFVPCIICQNMLHIFFDKDNVSSLNNQNCGTKSDWVLVDYENIGINAINNSSTGLRSNNESCRSIPIFLIPKSTFKFVAYVKTHNANSGIGFAVYLEESDLIATFAYNRLEEGWREISWQIEKGGLGYINLLGYSRDNEMVLIDSVQYSHNTKSIDDYADKIKNIQEISEEIDIGEIMQKDSGGPEPNNKSSEDLNDNSNLETLKNFKNNDSGALGPWAITLIVLACVTITALVSVSAYHVGKMMYPVKSPPVTLSEELPPVNMIPRVRGTVDDFEDPVPNYI